MCRMRHRLLLLLIAISLPISAQEYGGLIGMAQRKLNKPVSTPTTFWGKQVVHMLPREDLGVMVSVWSKWTSPSQGQFRFELLVGDGVPSSSQHHPTSKDGDSYLEKLEPCAVGIDLTGADGFPAGHVNFSKAITINEAGLREGFKGNGTSDMSRSAYQALIASGNWTFTWTC